MNLELYDMICAVLYCLTEDHTFTETEVQKFMQFYRKNKIRFHHKKCNDRPFFQLKKEEGRIVLAEDGRPFIMHTVYNNSSKRPLPPKLLLPLEWVPKQLDELHKVNVNLPTESCKPSGVKALVKNFNDIYSFKGINSEVKKYLKNCATCALNKSFLPSHPPPPIPIRSFHPFHRVQFDLVDIATNARKHLRNNKWGYRYILVIKDCFSKFCWLFPLQKKEAPLIHNAACFLFQIEGFPTIFQSDNGKEFVAEILAKFLEQNNVQIKHGKPYHPQSQGQVENLNKRVKNLLSRYLQNLTKDDQASQWPMFLPAIANNINNTWHSTIDDIPFRVYKQREPSSIISTIIPDDASWDNNESLGDFNSDSDNDYVSTNDDQSDSDEDIQTAGDQILPLPITLMSETELFQICTSPSLVSASFNSKEKLPKIKIDNTTECIADEAEFSLHNFNFSLYNMGKKQQKVNLSALESTEYVIHRNIKYRYI